MIINLNSKSISCTKARASYFFRNNSKHKNVIQHTKKPQCNTDKAAWLLYLVHIKSYNKAFFPCNFCYNLVMFFPIHFFLSRLKDPKNKTGFGVVRRWILLLHKTGFGDTQDVKHLPGSVQGKHLRYFPAGGSHGSV
jgi:hypothetical protein